MNGNILAVVAVGSAVRPDVPSADIDLAVICEDPSALKAVPPLEADLRAYPAAEVDSQLKSGHDMLGWAVRFGRVLYQRNSFWENIRNSWDHRLPLPSSKLSRKRATAAYRHLSTVVQFGDVDAAHEQALSYLTHLARAELLDSGVYPASRPELAGQLRVIGNLRLAEWLDRLLKGDLSELSQFGMLSRLF
jgi:predicted nucleotidyltransferase